MARYHVTMICTYLTIVDPERSCLITDDELLVMSIE